MSQDRAGCLNVLSSSIRIMLAGPVCISFSMMGKRLQTADPAYQTHKAHYSWASSCHDILIVENVCEYDQELVQKELGRGWRIAAAKVDPRILGLGAARARVYMLAWRASKFTWSGEINVQDFFDTLTSKVMLDASSYFWKTSPPTKLSAAEELRNQVCFVVFKNTPKHQ